jgi:hypothetical protein
MGIRLFGFVCFAILFFLMLYEPLVNAWFLSSPTTRIVPKRVTLRAKQQWVRRKPICFVSADEGTPASVISMKVRAMASFLSMAMIESLLASGVPIETILGGVGDSDETAEAAIAVSDEVPSQDEGLRLEKEISTVEHQKEGDRKFALKDEFSPLTTSDAQLEKEVSTSLHRKEGDRNVALKDGFAPEEPDDLSSLPTAITMTASEPNGIENASGIEDTAPTDTSESKVDPLSLLPLSEGTNTPHLIPPVPPAISTAFGRPLPLIREHVPPLQQPPELTTASSPSIASTVVGDEDPYGE